MDKKLEQIYKIVESSFEESDYKYHILPVIKYAKELAKMHEVDLEVVEIAALLHDIGRTDIENDAEHHIVGVPKAEKILQDLGYSKDIIEEVKHCVLSHRAIKSMEPRTLIAKIVSNADAISHFDMLPIFYFWRSKRNIGVAEINEWVEKKLERDWNEKLTLDGSRELVAEKYEAIKVLLSAMKQYE